MILLVLLFVGCYALPPLLPYDYTDLDYYALQQPPSLEHWFGTNALGQDLLAQTLRGMQKSMLIGVCVALISTTHRRDRRLGRRLLRRLARPGADVAGRPAAGGAELHPDRDRHTADQGSGSILWLIVLLAAFSWMVSSRMVRGLTMSLREREFVRRQGIWASSSRRVIVHHILPNVASILIIDTTLNVGFAILAETGLSFLGFGVQPPDVSLGTLIADGTPSVTTFPWVFLFPAGALVLIVLCANLTGDGLRDALDPGSRSARRRSGGASDSAAGGDRSERHLRDRRRPR